MDFGDYFSNMLKNSSDNRFAHFAKKQASSAYDVFSRSYVADMDDFINDLTSIL